MAVKLARINTLLLIAIILVNGYIILLPLLPGILFKVAQANTTERSVLEAKVHAPVQTNPVQSNPGTSQENRLVIPSMLLDQPVYEGKDESVLKKGLWRRPQTSTPEQGGNTVIVGHRLTYTNPRGTLYHLDKIKIGDNIGLNWAGKNYVYTVREIKVVTPAAVEVEAPTKEPQLTIYTCTPLWMPRDRLVVIATPATGEKP